jgi:hypothetical protein
MRRSKNGQFFISKLNNFPPTMDKIRKCIMNIQLMLMRLIKKAIEKCFLFLHEKRLKIFGAKMQARIRIKLS